MTTADLDEALSLLSGMVSLCRRLLMTYELEAHKDCDGCYFEEAEQFLIEMSGKEHGTERERK